MKKPIRIAIYARYSTDNQNATSIEGQVQVCGKLIADQFGSDVIIQVFSDAAISGTTMRRNGIKTLLAEAAKGSFDFVVSEGLDRLSRSQSDIAVTFELLNNIYGVKIHTAHEGVVNELHVGLKGTMNALFLKDLKAKTRRGQIIRIESGRPMALTYGYQRGRAYDEKGHPILGLREINPEQANVVRRVFEEFCAQKPTYKIVEDLNLDGIPSPRGRYWSRQAIISGKQTRGQGILANQIYIGKLIYGRTKTMRNPITGKIKMALQPETEWKRGDAPDLQIVSNELWEKAQERLRLGRQKAPKKIREYRYNTHQMTGWVLCGSCGEKKHLANKKRYVCGAARYKKTCKNTRGEQEPVIREALFQSLFWRVDFGKPFRPSFESSFAERIDAHNKNSSEERELLEQIDRLMQSIQNGVDVEHSTQRVLGLQKELKAVRVALASHDVPHFPEEETIRRQLWVRLKQLEKDESVPPFRDMMKYLVKKIVLTPILSKQKGETIDVCLKEDGWLDYWLSLQKF